MLNNIESVKKINQTIDGAVSTGDCIYNDGSSWKQAIYTVPQGIYQGSNTVVTFGLCTLSGLTVGKIYYMKIDSTLSSDSSDAFNSIKVGYAVPFSLTSRST